MKAIKVLFCGIFMCGVYTIGGLLTPLLFYVGQSIWPYYYESSVDPEYSIAWDVTNGEQIAFLWSGAVVASLALTFATGFVYVALSALFSESPKEKRDEDTLDKE